jgi:hypothetical protein
MSIDYRTKNKKACLGKVSVWIYFHPHAHLYYMVVSSLLSIKHQNIQENLVLNSQNFYSP